MKILLVDDSTFNVNIVANACRKWNHSIITASNGIEALDRYQNEAPDLVLMDVLMPIMDGFEATIRIRAMQESRWVQIILLTSLDTDKDLVQGIESGADDYITKPINFTVLREKIRVMERIATMQKQLNSSLIALQNYHAKAEEERMLATRVMERIIKLGQVNDSLVNYQIIPAFNFSGDLVAHAYTPSGNLHVALADATSHGLAAALNVLPIAEIFYSMTAKNFSIAALAKEMNTKIRLLMPRERFVAGVLVEIDFNQHLLKIWNGGCPAVLLVNQSGEVIHNFLSEHPPLGILSENSFSDDLQIHPWLNDEGQLLMCSDGLLEAENLMGVPFGLNGLISTILGLPPTERLDRIMAILKQHLTTAPQLDDISLLTIG